MSRPEFPIGCVLPVECIRRIRENQEYYDADPERYERMERQRKEQRELEREEERQEYERQQEGE